MKHESFAQLLQSARRQHYDAASDAASAIGVSRSLWHGWEHGHYMPRPEKLKAIVEALKLKRNEIERAIIADVQKMLDREIGV